MLNYSAVNDGYLDTTLKMFFDNGVEDKKYRIPIHSFLVETEDHLILIDTGCGNYFGPTAGNLASNFAKTKKKLEDVTLILCTHLHPDHIGGLNLFANATVCISEFEADYWVNEKKEVSPYNQKHVAFVREMIKSFEGKILLFRPGEILLPGLNAIEAYGHTPGHSAFLISSEKGDLLLIGDCIHHAEIQLNDLKRLVKVDDNPEEGALSRIRLIEKAVKENLLIGGAHLPGSGFGRVKQVGKTFQFCNEEFEGRI